MNQILDVIIILGLKLILLIGFVLSIKFWLKKKNNIEWFIVSKAFLRSIRTPNVVCLLSKDDVISSIKSMIANDVECLCLNPYLPG